MQLCYNVCMHIKEAKIIDEYYKIVEDLLRHKKVQQMKQYYHHGKISTHFHCVYVSYTVYKVCCRLQLSAYETTRAALLHDFYLYDWHITKHDEKHAWYHPKAAVKNIEKYIGPLSDVQRNMILCHMWPLHPAAPKSIGGFVLTFADKHCADMELLGFSHKFEPIYNHIMERIEYSI